MRKRSRSAALAAVAAATLLTAWASRAQAPPPLASAKSWGYFLTDIRPAEVAASGFDLVVLDYSSDGTEANEFSPAQVRAMQRKPDGSRRIVLAYLSVGEAEEYRYYWRRAWKTSPPPWLDEENPDWEGNYKVRYWDAGWQSLLMDGPDSYLGRIAKADFDGVYLDIIDAYEYYEHSRPTAAQDMVGLVGALAGRARAMRPADPFYVVPQNGEGLLEWPGYLDLVSGVAKEDLFYGYEKEGAPTPEAETAYSLRFLRMARAAGKPVFTVDYVKEPAQVAEVYRRSREEGFVPYATVRDLDRLVCNEGFDPPPACGIAETVRLRISPGQFFATTVPKGAWRLNVGLEYWRERYEYYANDFWDIGPENRFVAQRYYELYAVATATYGLTDHWEVGVGVPYVRGYLHKDRNDHVSGVWTLDEQGGLGDVRLLVANGHTWKGGDANLLASLEVDLPTDTRTAPFAGGYGEAHLSVTGERYWGRAGLIGTAGVDYYREKEAADSTAEFGWQAGAGYQFTDRLFGSALLGGAGENVSLELSFEYVYRRGRSVEFFLARDLSGPARAVAFGVALNFYAHRSGRKGG